MRFDIVFAPAAVDALKALPARARTTVREAIARHQRYDRRKPSKNRITRLWGLERPQFRLRVDEINVFYDITTTAVEILAIIEKHEAHAWLAASGTPEPNGGAG